MASPFHRWLPPTPAISSGVDGSWGAHDQRRPAFVVASRWSPVFASAYGLSNECLIVMPLHMPGNGAGDLLKCKQCSRALIGLRL